ncbi:polysaccharide lyase 8 family protein [Paenibacillus alkaliterrae]|uniref:polysaccharide lyase 8 family protein n=1 Tax=Paenibacillus alkaliterrae TaxID=320909 RepID=UPI001F450B2C|nr:polysaccharide lyase 8 family protein [Paenibacillus alkaliterrae]MCF2937968.1 polysaccharide lyase 8 family protein [Paenibacillus alkaliterrae]
MKKKISFVLAGCLLLSLFPSFPLSIESVVSAEEALTANDELRQRWFNKLTGNDRYDPNDPDIAAYITDLTDRITNDEKTGRWDTMNKSADRTYLWDFLTSTTVSSEISWAYGILRDMALAYSIQGSELYQNEALKNDIIRALDWMYVNRYNENKNVYGNWWDWEIGTPQIANNIMVLMYDDLTSTQLNNYIKAIDRFVPDPTKRDSLNNDSFRETGANLLDKALVVTLRGVLGNNSAKVNQGRDSIGQEYVYVDHGDGVYRDGSLVQHFNIAYTGSYGSVWISRTADMLYLLKDSPWEVTDPNVNNVFDWVAKSFEPLIYKGAMMDMVRGRAISRQNSTDHTTGRSTILTLLRLAEGAPPEEALKIKRMIKQWIQTDTTFADYIKGLPLYEMNLVKSLMNNSEIGPQGELVKHQVFAGMDRVVHLRPGFGFGISMFSDRISAFEYGNGENIKGWYTGLGMTYLYNNDLIQFSNDFWPTVDSFRLPGTTTDGSGKGVTPRPWYSYPNTRTWVGGSSIDGLYGAAGIDFSLEKVTGSSLQGKKSWFMFDDEIVALGSGIKSAEGRQVETVVENRQLNDSGDNTFTVNGETKPAEPGWSESMDNVKWAYLEGNAANSDIGYYFPGSASVHGLREARTGSWNEINTGGPSDPITRSYLSVAFDHGANPANASYSYVLLPNKDAAATASYSENPDIEILSNSADVHAVRETTLGITAANFFQPGKADFITAHDAASVMVREADGKLTLAVSDPTQKQDSVTVELDKTGLTVANKDNTVEVLQTSPKVIVKINVAGSIGKTHDVMFKDIIGPTINNAVIRRGM